MTSAQRTKLKKKLLALDRELAGKGPTQVRLQESVEDPSPADEDEQPLNEMLQSIASNRNRNLDGTRGRIQRALEKIARTPDEFGLCEDCGDPVPLGRLEAMPYAERCVACQGQKDGLKGLPTRRKITDYQS